jgi:hypothetical protein
MIELIISVKRKRKRKRKKGINRKGGLKSGYGRLAGRNGDSFMKWEASSNISIFEYIRDYLDQTPFPRKK